MLIVLEKYDFVFDRKLIDLAKRELKNKIDEMEGESFTWGYFSEFGGAENYPSCVKLANSFNDLFNGELDWKLAFVRLAVDEPRSDFGGMHVDVNIGISHEKPESFKDKEVARVLINLHEFSRRVRFCFVGRDELIAEGVKISKEEYDL